MNKKDYIKAVDNITAPQELLDRIEALVPPKKKKKPVWKTVTAVAACFVAVVIAFSGIFGGLSNGKLGNITAQNGSYGNVSFESPERGTYDKLFSTSDKTVYNQLSDTMNGTSSSVTTDRKIVKTAALHIKTNDYESFMTGIKQKIEQYNGYVVQSQEYNYDNKTDRNANMKVKIPADKLESFIEELASMGTVTSKTIGSDDITNSYIDVESRIKALETEQEALLGLMEKAESLADVISLQDRLSDVRADLEALKAQKQSYDEMVAYSEVSVDIREVERVVEGDDTFFGEAKEKLMNNIYDLADSLRELAINLIASLPYIAIIGVAAAVVIVVIVRKVRKR